jgi:hypothetical protein
MGIWLFATAAYLVAVTRVWPPRTKEPCSSEDGAAAANWQGSSYHGRDGKRRKPRYNQDGPAQKWSATGWPPWSRMPTRSTTWASTTVGRPSSCRSSRAVTIMLFGRLEAAGALRWEDWAVVSRRWSERGVSGCAASGADPLLNPVQLGAHASACVRARSLLIGCHCFCVPCAAWHSPRSP